MQEYLSPLNSSFQSFPTVINMETAQGGYGSVLDDEEEDVAFRKSQAVSLQCLPTHYKE